VNWALKTFTCNVYSHWIWRHRQKKGLTQKSGRSFTQTALILIYLLKNLYTNARVIYKVYQFNHYLINFYFKVSHIFRKDNRCTYKLASLSISNRLVYSWYDRLFPSLYLNFFHNRYKLYMFRFTWLIVGNSFVLLGTGFGLVPMFVSFLYFFSAMCHVMANDCWNLGCQSSWDVRFHSDI